MAVRREELDSRLLLGSFAAVIATFFAANAWTQHSMRHIDDASDAIAFNSAPSIERLAAVRTGVRHAELLTSSAFARRGPGDRAALERAVADLNADASAYLALPTFPGEKDFWGELNASILAFNVAVERALAQLDVGAPQAARAELGDVAAAADRVSAATARAIEFNAQNGRGLAMRIKAVRRESAAVGYALNASCVVFAALAALLVRRQIRRHAALVEECAVLEQSRASELEAFAARAAHDILNPISATQMALTLLVKRDLPDARSRELIQRAARNLRRVGVLVDGLLQFARAGASAPSSAAADVPAVVEDVASGLALAAEEGRVEVRVEGVCACSARCSVGVLTSVLSNLAQNALKYMAERPSGRRITFRAEERAGFVRVEVEDNGPGVAPELREAIFLPYVRGPSHGTDGLGLGLATVKRLCEAHGGRAGVRPAAGEGSIFWIEIPRASGCAPAESAPGTGAASDHPASGTHG